MNFVEEPNTGGKLKSEDQIVRFSVIKAIVRLWPNSEIDEKRAQDQIYSLVDGCAFWFKVLRTIFKIKLTEWLNEEKETVR